MNAQRSKQSDSIRKLLTAEIKACPKSRNQIANEMSEVLGIKVTESSLYMFTSEAKRLHRWPAEYDLAFCLVVGSWSLLEDRVRRAGFRMIGPEEERLIKIGRAYEKLSKAKKALLRAGGEI